MRASVTLTLDQWQALANLLDSQFRGGGLQAAVIYGPIAAEIVTAVQRAEAEKP